MIRHLSKHNEDGQSTNGWVDSDEFPTNYFAASWVCQFVSCSFWPHVMSMGWCTHGVWMDMSPLMFDGHDAPGV